MNYNDYVDIVLKLLIGILYAIFVMKISGKSNLAPMAPLDQIQNYILGGVIGGVLYNRDITILSFIFVMTTWAVISVGLNIMRKKIRPIKKALDGMPIVVIENGEIVREGVEKAKLPIPDLYLKLRIEGIFDIESIEHAQIEQNGQIVILEKGDIKKMPILLVIDKVIQDDNLKKLGKTSQWIDKIMKEHKIKSLDDIAAIEYYNDEVRIIDFNG